MIWFFQRNSSRLQYEIRHQTDGHDYELVITYPDGGQEVERYSDASEILERSMQLHSTLVAAGWEPPVAQIRAMGRARLHRSTP